MKTSIHHLVPKSKWGSNERVNKLVLPDKAHVNIHRFFYNDTPVEQLSRLLKLNTKCLTPEFKREISEILDWGDNEYYYKDWVWVK